MTRQELELAYAELNAREDSLLAEREKLEAEVAAFVNSDDVSKCKKEDLKREVEIRRRIAEIDNEFNEIDKQYEELGKQEDAIVEEEERVRAEERSLKKKAAITLTSVVLAGLLGFSIGRCAKKNCSSNEATVDKSITVEETTTPEVTPAEESVVIVPTATPEVTLAPTPTATPVPTATPEPTPVPVLVDVTNDDDIANAADRLVYEDLDEVLENSDDIFFNSFEMEDVEDMVRLVNGQLPKNSTYDDYTIGETANLMAHLFANQGSKGNELYPVHFSHFYPDGSKEAQYVESYDEIYNMIAKYRAEGNVDGVVEMVGLLGSKLYNEWHLAGLYGGYNPYLFPDEEHYFLLQAATSRFPNYVREYLESNDLTVCIPTCYELESGEYKLVEVRDIFEAMYMGTSRNGEISVIRSGEVINIFGETFADAKTYLDNKAKENVKVLN